MKIAGHEKHTTTVKHYVAMDKDMTRKVGAKRANHEMVICPLLLVAGGRIELPTLGL